jgi:hypothetical protein
MVTGTAFRFPPEGFVLFGGRKPNPTKSRANENGAEGRGARSEEVI